VIGGANDEDAANGRSGMPGNRHPCAESILFIGFLVWSLGGCRSSADTIPQGSAAAPPTVQVAVVEQRDVTLISEWIASMDGYVNARIQPHVSGYLIRQNYREGSFVRKGDVLFEIDPRPFQAALDQSRAQAAQAKSQLTQAQAQVVQAQAQLAKTEQDVVRDAPLAQAKAIAQSRLDDDIQARAGASAAVAAAQAAVAAGQSAVAAAVAAVEQAELNLSFTKLTSLVDGVAGLAQAQIGDLVETTTVLTSVSQVDPIKVYFSMSEQDYLHGQKPGIVRTVDTNTPLARVPLTLVLSDGSTYPQTGKVLWTDRQIDTSTGTIRVAAAFPNPGNILRPGEYGKVRAMTESRSGALLVPQAGVTELQGNYQVAVVNQANKVEIHQVQVGAQVEGNWVVTKGVAAGDRVVVGGLQRATPGTTVNPIPASAPAKEP
jgi:RND family efflux transporter MFP subunit